MNRSRLYSPSVGRWTGHSKPLESQGDEGGHSEKTAEGAAGACRFARAGTGLALASALFILTGCQTRGGPEKAIAEIRSLGGVVEVDETRPNRPVIKVNLAQPEINDSALK